MQITKDRHEGGIPHIGHIIMEPPRSVHVRPIHVSLYNVVIKYRCPKTLRLNMRLCIHVRINPNDICQNSDFFWYLFGSYDMMLSLQLWCSAVQYGSLYGS